MKSVTRFIGPLIVVALVVAAGVSMLGGGDERKTMTAYFPRAISVYEGSDVRVLGVPVGQIDSVTPEGTRVKIVMSYDADTLIPADAEAVIISPSIVGDRYVQLTPAYTSGPVLEDGVELDEGRTAVPLELDEVYASLDELTVALGPNGANRNGALTDLIEVTAANFAGQGAKFKQTINDFSRFSETLEGNKEELFGSAAELEKFINTLAENDQTVRQFNDSLAQVSTLLAGERQELSAALSNLAVALGEVGTFVKDNRDALGRNIRGINRVAKVLVKQRAALTETLRIAPLALSNLALTYNPDAGTLDTNANIGELENQIEDNPTVFLCGLVAPSDPTGSACDLIESLDLPRTGPFGAAGTGSSSDLTFDLSLGGLAEVQP